jgi:hypothetical protein
MINRNSSAPDSHHRGKRTVLAVFPPSVKVIEPKSNREADLEVNGHAINVKWVGQGHLGDVRKALNDLPIGNFIFVARHMSPGARNALFEAGINWADESGAAEISIGTILISKTGVPQKKDRATKRWTPGVISVAEALLCGTHGTQSATQTTTGLSAGSCANALRFLSEQELLTSRAKRGPRSARRIANRREFLSKYADAVNEIRPGIEIEIGISWQDILSGISKLGGRFDDSKTDWAVTGAAAAAVLAPFLSSVNRATVYVNAISMAELHAIALAAELRPIQGGRLTLKPFPTVSVQRLSKHFDGLRIAPWPRVYADLLREGVRGEEAAEHLFEVIHGR